jgi:hypothetical protein
VQQTSPGPPNILPTAPSIGDHDHLDLVVGTITARTRVMEDYARSMPQNGMDRQHAGDSGQWVFSRHPVARGEKGSQFRGVGPRGDDPWKSGLRLWTPATLAPVRYGRKPLLPKAPSLFWNPYCLTFGLAPTFGFLVAPSSPRKWPPTKPLLTTIRANLPHQPDLLGPTHMMPIPTTGSFS